VWVARLDTSANSGASAIVLDASRNVYVTGYSNAGQGSDNDYATVKYDTGGHQQWIARYNGPANGNDFADAIGIDSTNNIYATGWSEGVGTGYDFATIEYDPNGHKVWSARYDGPVSGDDGASDMATDTAGNVYVTGSSYGVGNQQDWATIWYDKNGDEWVVRYHGPTAGNDYPSTLALDAAGSVYVTGASMDPDSGYDCVTIKYDRTGVEKWLARLAGPVGVSTGAVRLPRELSLDASPNPASQGTVIHYSVAAAANVSLKLYDISGALVKTIAAGHVPPGCYSVSLHAGSLARGVYILKLEAGAGDLTRKIVIE
jgi:hypothetical protein